MTDVRERIRSRIEAVLQDGCWLPTGELTVAGYKHVVIDGVTWYLHRLTFTVYRGPIPPGAVLDHVVCERRWCANPWHVEPATIAGNVMRSPLAPAAINAAKERCVAGHPLTGANLMERIRGGRVHRQCRECDRRRARDWRAARR